MVIYQRDFPKNFKNKNQCYFLGHQIWQDFNGIQFQLLRDQNFHASDQKVDVYQYIYIYQIDVN